MRWSPQILEAVWMVWLSYTRMALGGRGLTREAEGRTQEGGTVWMDPSRDDGKEWTRRFQSLSPQPPDFGFLQLLPKLVLPELQ